MITRRDFLRGMAALFAAPVVAKLDLLEAQEHIDYLGSLDGVRIVSMGKKMVKSGDAEYPVLVYHLRKGAYESYMEVDKQLVDLSGDPEQFIRAELKHGAWGINEAIKQGLRPTHRALR
jgi:hypothetical protein